MLTSHVGARLRYSSTLPSSSRSAAHAPTGTTDLCSLVSRSTLQTRRPSNASIKVSSPCRTSSRRSNRARPDPRFQSCRQCTLCEILDFACPVISLTSLQREPGRFSVCSLRLGPMGSASRHVLRSVVHHHWHDHHGCFNNHPGVCRGAFRPGIRHPLHDNRCAVLYDGDQPTTLARPLHGSVPASVASSRC
jgi:hypothetical protein